MKAAHVKLPILLVLAATALTLQGSPMAPPEEQAREPGQVFVLQDYRWVPVVVRRTPTVIDCRFEVVTGTPTVHAELVTERDFILFSRHRDYDTLALTLPAASSGFERVVLTPGRYRVLIRNERGAPPAAVSLVVRTEVDPAPSMISSKVPLRRQLTVIAISLSVFFATAFWSGRKLLRAYRGRA